MVYVGVDLHRKRSQVVVVDAEGQSLLSRRIDNDPGEFLRIFGEPGPEPVEVAFEATYGWGGSLICSPTPASRRTCRIPKRPKRSPPRG